VLRGRTKFIGLIATIIQNIRDRLFVRFIRHKADTAEAHPRTPELQSASERLLVE
jgi:hypothetical protein